MKYNRLPPWLGLVAKRIPIDGSSENVAFDASQSSITGKPPRPRWAIAIFGILVCLLPLTILAARIAIRSNVNDVRDWLPAHYSETVQYEWFRTRFGSEEFVVVSWPGCTLDDARLQQLSVALTERSRLVESAGKPPLFTQIMTGRELVDDLTGVGAGLTLSQALNRLKGTIIGPDLQQTCAVITLSEDSRIRLSSALSEIRNATVACGVAEEDVHLGGPAVVNDAIDKSSSQSLVRLAGLAAFVGLVVAWLCFREVRLTVIVFLISGYSALLSLAVVPVCGMPLNAILITMVPLVYVAAMSGAIHLSNYYLENLEHADSNEAIRLAIRQALLPLSLAASTTAVGLVSLWYSDLAPIRMFGLFSAVGVLLSLAMQLIALPALLCMWPSGKSTQIASTTSSENDPALSAWEWKWSAEFIAKRHAWFVSLFLILSVFGLAGLARVETSIQIMRLFANNAPIISSYDWLERNLGAMIPLEVVIRFGEQSQADQQSQPKASKQPGASKSVDNASYQRLELIREIHESIAKIDGVSGCLSGATFARPARQEPPSIRRVLENVRLKQTRARLVEAGYLSITPEDESWRISLRVSAGEDLDYGDFQQFIRKQVEPILERERTKRSQDLSAVYTGAVPIIYKARRSLLNGLALGFGTDVLLVMVAVIVLMRNWSSGLLLGLTCVFPFTMVFGLMGWCHWVVDIGTVMAPCVALGVTVDDSIHFLLWFRRGTKRGMNRSQAIGLAYATCGRAMLQSWGVIGLGLSVFALSSFVPTFRFGILTLSLLTASLVSNLIFLPAFLAGPLGASIADRAGGKPADRK
ncbi:MAG: efflux RND transporter permease subunit [Pirellula sp.]